MDSGHIYIYIYTIVYRKSHHGNGCAGIVRRLVRGGCAGGLCGPEGGCAGGCAGQCMDTGHSIYLVVTLAQLIRFRVAIGAPNLSFCYFSRSLVATGAPNLSLCSLSRSTDQISFCNWNSKFSFCCRSCSVD